MASQRVAIVPQLVNGADILSRLEMIGRVCYNSEHKIGHGTAEKFVANLIKSGHESVLEHSTLTFQVTEEVMAELVSDYTNMFFLRATSNGGRYLLSGNIRALREVGKKCETMARLLGSIKAHYPVLFDEFPKATLEGCNVLNNIAKNMLTPEEQLVHKSMTAYLTTDRGISHELVRHRRMSYTQQSTRYVKFTEGLTVIVDPEIEIKEEEFAAMERAYTASAEAYEQLVKMGVKAQIARDVLPTSLATYIYMTGYLDQWNHVFALRCVNAAHPKVKHLMCELRETAYAYGIF